MNSEDQATSVLYRQSRYITTTAQHTGFLMALSVKYQVAGSAIAEHMLTSFENEYLLLLRDQVNDAYIAWFEGA